MYSPHHGVEVQPRDVPLQLRQDAPRALLDGLRDDVAPKDAGEHLALPSLHLRNLVLARLLYRGLPLRGVLGGYTVWTAAVVN